jgi:hypothetical protein
VSNSALKEKKGVKTMKVKTKINYQPFHWVSHNQYLQKILPGKIELTLGL